MSFENLFKKKLPFRASFGEEILALLKDDGSGQEEGDNAVFGV